MTSKGEGVASASHTQTHPINDLLVVTPLCGKPRASIAVLPLGVTSVNTVKMRRNSLETIFREIYFLFQLFKKKPP